MTDKEQKPSTATQLVEIAQELYSFGVSSEGETFAVPHTGPSIVRMLRGGKTSLRGQLAREYFNRYQRAAPQQALADALLVVEGTAQDQPETELHLRVARDNNVLWLDLGDETGRAVCLTDQGWSVLNAPSVRFKRTALNSALPEPEHGDISELWDWLNVTPDDRPLIVAWLVSTLMPDIPHPILGLFGEQGTGKSTAEKVLVTLIDPSPVPLRKPPRDADSWVTAAAGSWVVGLDNLSAISEWLSDSLCRASTGDGDVRRRLYTDGELSVFSYRRCLIINGIDLGALHGDLSERLLPIYLDTISDESRREEDELWPAWQAAHPRLLGAILTVTAGVLAALPSVRLERKPRMADFARILAAVDQVLGTDGYRRYLGKQGEIAEDSISGDPFITAIRDTFTGGDFTGTAQELLTAVQPTDPEWRAPKGWPSSARNVTTLLKRHGPSMRKAGWQADHDSGANKQRVTKWTITPPRPEMAGKSSPPSPPSPPMGDDLHKQRGETAGDVAGQAGVAGNDPRSSESLSPPSPPPLNGVSAGHDATAGQAGVAGMEYGLSQDVGSSPDCRHCGHDLWHPENQQRGTCARCHKAADRT